MLQNVMDFRLSLLSNLFAYFECIAPNTAGFFPLSEKVVNIANNEKRSYQI